MVTLIFSKGLCGFTYSLYYPRGSKFCMYGLTYSLNHPRGVDKRIDKTLECVTWTLHLHYVLFIKKKFNSETFTYVSSHDMHVLNHNVTESNQLVFTSSISPSFWYDFTSAPTIGAQVLRQNTFRMHGSLCPCIWTMLAICITGSLSGSGNMPEDRRENVMYLCVYINSQEIPESSSNMHNCPDVGTHFIFVLSPLWEVSTF